MVNFSVNPIIVYSTLGFIVVLKVFGVYMFLLWYKTVSKDIIIFLDKSDRWRIVYENIKESTTYSNNNKKYVVNDGILNRKGKALYVYSDNHPSPMNIKYNKNKWLTSESLMAVINNNLIQKLVKPADDFKDKLLLFGAIGGIIAGISGVVILLKTTGVI